jgi:uncharacterized protein (DUF2062 family)
LGTNNKQKTVSQLPEMKGNWFISPLYKAYKRFLKIRGQPREIALGFALGLFVGMTPFFGLHTVIAVPLAALFKWNKISAAISVWFTNAATAPIIYSINYLVGARIIGIQKGFSWADINSLSAVYHMILKAPEIVWAMIVGGVVLGLPLAVAGYYVIFVILRRYQENIRIKLKKSKQRLARRRKRPKKKKGTRPTVIKPAPTVIDNPPSGRHID